MHWLAPYLLVLPGHEVVVPGDGHMAMQTCRVLPPLPHVPARDGPVLLALEPNDGQRQRRALLVPACR